MGWPEAIWGIVLGVALVLLAVFTGLRQWWALRKLRSKPDLPADEQRYLREQAWRRLASALLLLILVALFGIIQTVLEKQREQVVNERSAQLQIDPSAPASEAQRQFIRTYTGAWIAVLLILLMVVVLVAVDLWSLRRYALSQHRKLLNDRLALERQVLQLRQERNGHK